VRPALIPVYGMHAPLLVPKVAQTEIADRGVFAQGDRLSNCEESFSQEVCSHEFASRFRRIGIGVAQTNLIGRRAA
jgi:hypothetical protein